MGVASTALMRQLADGSISNLAYNISNYLCTNFGAFIKKCTIRPKMTAYPLYYLRIINLFIRTSNRFSRYQINSVGCCNIFYRPDGRLVKLLLFSTLDKSTLTFIYFTTFESKIKVRSPLPTQPNFLVFGKYANKILFQLMMRT